MACACVSKLLVSCIVSMNTAHIPERQELSFSNMLSFQIGLLAKKIWFNSGFTSWRNTKKTCSDVCTSIHIALLFMRKKRKQPEKLTDHWINDAIGLPDMQVLYSWIHQPQIKNTQKQIMSVLNMQICFHCHYPPK
jgi:hypothetical protein